MNNNRHDENASGVRRNKYGNVQQNTQSTAVYIPEEYVNFYHLQEDRLKKICQIDVEPNHVHMLPFGGIGEIGMNALAYHYAGRWLLIDCGNSFDKLYSNVSHVVVPSVKFLQERLDIFDGIVLTHGHEDHIGALAYVWPELRCNLYASKFTAALIRRKFEERGLPTDQIIEIEVGGWYDIGTFKIKWILVSHSIPGACMVALRTPHGSILHTGDWKIDDRPLINEKTDFDAIKELAQEDLHAIVSDSTNIMVEGINPTEESVYHSLVDMISTIKTGKIFVTFFSTNISRLYSCIHAAKKAGRKIGILGRALQRSYEVAVETGYLDDCDHVLLEGIDEVPSDQIIIACSGSQGEERSALKRIALGTHKYISTNPGDTVIFSCRLIPTNAKELVSLENALMRKGVKVITNKDALVHSSGHATRDEFDLFYRFIKEHAVRPIWSLPCHGTSMFLERHAHFARERGFLTFSDKESFHDGKLYRICPDVQYVDEIDHEIRFIDGNKLVSTHSPLVAERKSLQEGFISIAVVLSNNKRLLHTNITSYGVDEDRGWIEYEVRKIIYNVFNDKENGSMSLNRQIRSRIVQFTRGALDKQIHIDLHIIHESNLRTNSR